MFAAPKDSELRWGVYYALFALFILPFLLQLCCAPLWALDCVASILNAGILAFLLRRFLLHNLKQAFKKPGKTGLYILLGAGSCWLFTRLFQLAFPEHVNLNDAAVLAQLGQSGLLGVICTVFLTPVFEELLFRGLLFRGLYDRKPVIAWGLCCMLFPLAHILSYWGQYTPAAMLLAFLQYLPAGFLLCFTYRRSGTIITSMVIHILINLISVVQGGSLWH